MNEHNSDTLRAAIQQLPVYAAPPEIWNRVDAQLRIDRQEQMIKTGIQELPRYSAPVETWERIQEKIQTTGGRRTWLIPAKQLRRIAAVGVILAGLIWLWTANTTKPKAVYTDYQEKADPYLQQEDWDADEAAFSEVIQQFEQHQKVFQDPANETLRQEFQILEEDRRELKKAMETYGKSPELIRQLAGLERNRTEIIKEMAAKI